MLSLLNMETFSILSDSSVNGAILRLNACFKCTIFKADKNEIYL